MRLPEKFLACKLLGLSWLPGRERGGDLVPGSKRQEVDGTKEEENGPEIPRSIYSQVNTELVGTYYV